MKLTNADKEYLKEIGYSEKDYSQIEMASGKSDYQYQGKKIGQRKAMELLGRKTYLSGIARSAFHWTACRETADGKQVHFDSSRFFKE